MRTASQFLEKFPPDLIVAGHKAAWRGEVSSFSHRPEKVKAKGIQVLFKPSCISDQATVVLVREPMPKLSCEQWVYQSTASFDRLKEVAESAAEWLTEDEIKQMRFFAVTGTNGKSSVVHMARQLSEKTYSQRYPSEENPFKSHSAKGAVAALGTLGCSWADNGDEQWLETPNTTMVACDLFPFLAELNSRGVQTVFMEVSSHALAENRIRGIGFEAVAFTQLGRDHLDYHGDLEAYGRCKWSLSERSKGAVWVKNDDDFFASQVHPRKKTYGILKDDFSEEGLDLWVEGLRCGVSGVSGTLCARDEDPFEFLWPVYGLFNVENLMAAVALALEFGVSWSELKERIPLLTLPKGRLQEVPTRAKGLVLIDYAHTPDALSSVLLALKQHFGEAYRVRLLFGCGGDRDQGKRAEMGSIAHDLADECWVTSDNPRSEDPQSIIADIVKGMSYPVKMLNHDKVHVVVDRCEAIQKALASQCERDVLLLCGKGHESEQVCGQEVIPLDELKICQSY